MRTELRNLFLKLKNLLIHILYKMNFKGGAVQLGRKKKRSDKMDDDNIVVERVFNEKGKNLNDLLKQIVKQALSIK